jgi:hypothetical protein
MSLQAEYNAYRRQVSSGSMCKGDECGGWHLSDLDTWHECPCNAQKGVPHPETQEEPWAYVVFARVQEGRPHRALALRYTRDRGQDAARRYRDSGWPDVRLRFVSGEDALKQVEQDIEWVDSKMWDGDHSY